MDLEALLAAREGDLSRLKQRLDRGIDINARDENERTLLHHAASNGQAKVMECLLQNGADVLTTADKNYTALHIAVTRSDEALVRVILENVARSKLTKLLNSKTKATGTAALHLAAKQNSCVVDVLLEYGANFEIANNKGEKPMDLATGEDLRWLFQLINASFEMAKNCDAKLTENENWNDALFSRPVVNCRNNEGKTLLQVLVLHCKAEGVMSRSTAPPFKFLRLRMFRLHGRDLRAVREFSRQDEIDELAELAQDCLRLWQSRQQDVNLRLPLCHAKRRTGPLEFFTIQLGEAAMRKTHEVLLAYRRMEEEAQPPTANAALETLEEMFELFGFDAELLAGRSNFRYEQLPAKWYHDIPYLHWFFLNVENLICQSVEWLSFCLTSARMFRAARSDDTRKMQQLVNEKAITNAKVADESGRSILCYAVENGSKKMIKLLLKAGVKACCERDCDCKARSPLYLAVDGGRAKIVKLLLEKTDTKDLPELIDSRHRTEDSALHAAARLGRLDLAKMLLSYGATYSILDAEGRTPLDVSSNEEVSELLKLVESCFDDAKDAKSEVVYKLKEMQTDDFLAIASAKNEEGQTLAVVAAKANAKSIAGMVLRMIREVKSNKK